MKIIGGHDYYDGAGLGVDETVVFLRKEQIFEQTPLVLPGAIGSAGDRNSPSLRFFRLLIGGEVLPGVREHVPAYQRRTRSGAIERVHPQDRLHYDLEAALDALSRIEASGTSLRMLLDRTPPREKIRAFFGKTSSHAWTDWMVENRVVVGHNYRPEIGYRSGPNQLDANISTLKDLEAFRALDPATAHMRISNWIGGVLPHGPEPIEISDHARIRKAGFDTTTSFRMPKGTKKPRRRTS